MGTIHATRRSPSTGSGLLPSKMGKGLVGLGHAVRVLLFLKGGAFVVGGGHDLGGELFGHRLAFGTARSAEDPAVGQRLLALGAHLARHLVVGAADAARADLHRRADIADRSLKVLDRVVDLGLLLDDVERVVDDLAGGRLFTIPHDGVDKLFNTDRAVLDVRAGDIAIFYRATHMVKLQNSNYKLFLALNAIAAARYVALFDRGGIETAAHHLVADVDVLHAAGAHNNHRVLLEVVALARNVGGDLLAIGKAHAGYFADSRVRLAGGRGGHLGAHTALKGAGVKD